MLVADAAQFAPVAVGRYEGAAAVLHGFGEDRGDRLRALLGDGPLYRADAVEFRRRSAIAGEPKGVGDVADAREQWPEGFPDLGEAGDGQSAQGDTVVGHRPADDLRTFRLSLRTVVLAGELDRRLDRLRTGVDEVRHVQVARREFGDQARRLDGGRVGRAPVGGVREGLHLFGARGHHIGAAVADVHAEQPGQAVEVAPALVVVEVAAVAADVDRRRGVVPAVLAGEVRAEVTLGLGTQGGVLGHGALLRGHVHVHVTFAFVFVFTAGLGPRPRASCRGPRPPDGR